MGPKGKNMSNERYKGRAYARALSSRDLGMLCDALVLGDFDWRDWFVDKPSREFLRGFTDGAIECEQSSDGIEYDADHGGYY